MGLVGIPAESAGGGVIARGFIGRGASKEPLKTGWYHRGGALNSVYGAARVIIREADSVDPARGLVGYTHRCQVISMDSRGEL